MNQKFTIKFGSSSHIGFKREDNQDYYGKFPQDDLDLTNPKGQLFIVADGMGGHQGGQQASKLAVSIIERVYFFEAAEDISKSLKQAFEAANEQIHQRASSDLTLHGMGTTCTALVLKNDQAYIAHVGDSRAYRITRHQIQQLTQDHSKVAELQRHGILTGEEAKQHPQRFILNRALGADSEVKIDIIDEVHLNAGEYFLLCTDGLAKVEDEEIKRMVLKNSLQKACEKLIKLANERGGEDNVTIQIIQIHGEKRFKDKILDLISRNR